MSPLAKLRVALKGGERLVSIWTELGYGWHRPGRVLFDHIPKCGGSSVLAFLARNFPRRLTFRTRPSYPETARAFLSWSESRRFRHQLLMGHCTDVLVGHVHPDTLITTVLREPVDGIVSFYYYVRQEQARGRVAPDVVMPSSLTAFATGAHDPEIPNRLCQHFTGWTAAEIARSPAAAVDRAEDVINATYQVVGFQDDLEGFARELTRRAGLWSPLRGQRVNRTQKRPTLAELPACERDRIAALHAADVALYARVRASRVGSS